MTTPSPTTTTPSDGEPPPDTSCLCGHPADQHDLVAARYCKATVASALTRPCMCGAQPAVRY